MSADDPSRDEIELAFRLAAAAEKNARVVRNRPPKPKSRVEIVSSDEELSLAALKSRDRKQTISLKRTLAYFAIVAVSVQLLCANVMFALYLWTPEWRENTPPEVIIAWMSATVVEVIGIVVIIARNLFPANENGVTKRQLAKMLRKP